MTYDPLGAAGRSVTWQKTRDRQQRADQARRRVALLLARTAHLVPTTPTPAALTAAAATRDLLAVQMKGRVGWEAVPLPPSLVGNGGARVAMLSNDKKRVCMLHVDRKGALTDTAGRTYSSPLEAALHLVRQG